MKFQKIGDITYHIYKGKKLYFFKGWVDEDGSLLTGAMGPAFDIDEGLMFKKYKISDLIKVREEFVHKL